MRIEDFPFTPAKLRLFWNISLYRNASYLIIGNGLGALLGFVFWAAAARFYSTVDVGIATAAIAAMGMLGAISHLGLGLGLVKYLPGSGSRGNPMINTSLTLSLLTAILVSLIFILGIQIWSAELGFLRENIIYFLLFIFFAAATALGNITDNIFVAERRAGFVTARALFFSLGKLVLAVLLALTLNSYGILNSWGIVLIVSLLISLLVFLPRVRRGYLPRPSFQWREAAGLVRFSIFNNISLLLWSVPAWVLPLLMLNLLGAEANAYFYIAWTIGAALATVPTSVATSLFAEGSNEEKELEGKTIRSLSLVILVLIPVAVLIVVLGDKLLLLFGREYAENSFRLLQVVTIALFPLTVNQVYFSILRVQKRMKALVGAIAFTAAITIVVSLILLPYYGISSAGLGWLAGQAIIALWAMSEQHWWKPVLRQMFLLLVQRTGQRKQV